MPTMPSSPPAPPTAAERGIDPIAEAVMSLTREVWVLTDRLYVLERVLLAKGVTASEEVDRYAPTEAEAAELAEMRAGLLEGVLRSLKGSPA
jgi:hypothetical protein